MYYALLDPIVFASLINVMQLTQCVCVLQGPMGAPPTQYPGLGQNQNAGAYAAQGWGAAAYQQWPGQPNDPCKMFKFPLD